MLMILKCLRRGSHVFSLLILTSLGLPFSSPGEFKVGLVLDRGGKDDKSFNSSAYEGAMDAKKRLAREIVTQYHDAEAATAAQSGFEAQFSRGEVPDEMPEVSVASGISALQLLREAFGVTGGEAKRLIAGNAVSIDGEKVPDANSPLELKDGAVVKMGKRGWARLRVG